MPCHRIIKVAVGEPKMMSLWCGKQYIISDVGHVNGYEKEDYVTLNVLMSKFVIDWFVK